MNITLHQNSFNYELNGYKFNKYNNVSSYKYGECRPLLDIVHNVDDMPQCEIYYIFDAPGGDAFGHWIFESFIFVDYFLEIKKLYPHVKIVTSNKKRYVYNFFKMLNINNDIVYSMNKSNICFFSPVISLNDTNIDTIFFEHHIIKFVDKISSYINTYTIYNTIFLPRNTKDNFIQNDRIIHGSDNIEEHIIQIGGTSLNTYELNNIKLQLNIINSFTNIILDWGSSLLVNGIFLKNKNIIILDNYRSFYQLKFPAISTIYNLISKNNKLHLILPSDRSNTIIYDDIKSFLVSE
jgi:hypothetical protein